MMKVFSSQKSRIIPIFFAVILAGVLFFRGSIQIAWGGAGDNVRGYAWSSNVGWISFNCMNTGTCGASDYGVKICDSACAPSEVFNFQGYAWSSGAGWISFNEVGAPDYGFSSYCKNTCNSFNNCTACFNPDDGKIYGWAKVLNLGDDGWIKLGTTSLAFPNGAYIDQTNASSAFRGWGWDGNADPVKGVGWVSFNCANTGTCGTADYFVYLASSHLPEPINMSAPNWSTSSACSTDIAKNAILAWEFYDSDPGSLQTAFEIIVSSSTSSSSPNAFHTGKISSSVWQYNLLANGVQSAVQDVGNVNYWWWVRVWDNLGFSSGWKEGNFTVYSHDFPKPFFDWAPKDPNVGEVVTSTSKSFFYFVSMGTFLPCFSSYCAYYWSSPDALTNTAPNSSRTTMTFSYGTNKEIKLKVTDPSGYTCETSTTIFVDVLPFWKEEKYQVIY